MQMVDGSGARPSLAGLFYWTWRPGGGCDPYGQARFVGYRYHEIVSEIDSVFAQR